jgi:hypothetical protein
MCNAEFMVMSSLHQFQLKEDMKEMEREAAELAATRGLGAEELRDTLEQIQVRRWFDVENRKIAVAAGATAVVSAAAGVVIQSLGQQWAAAQVELFGAKMGHTARLAMAGDQRKHEILEVKQARLDAAEEAGSFEWFLAAAEGFAKGVALEQHMGTWDGEIFGVPLPPLLGGKSSDPLVPETTPSTRHDIAMPEDQTPILRGETADVFATDPLPTDQFVPTPPAPKTSFEDIFRSIPIHKSFGTSGVDPFQQVRSPSYFTPLDIYSSLA